MDEDRKWLFIRIGLVLAVIGLIGYGIFANNRDRLDITKYDKNSAISANDHNGHFDDIVLGDNNAKVTIIEYSDYQCPACARYASLFEGMVNDYPGQVKLIFRNFLLPGHIDARAASSAALAANRQGKFWEMHHELFTKQADWTDQGEKRTAALEKLAQSIGLDLNKFRTDMNSEEVVKKIKFDMELGKAHNLRGTPTIIINGETVNSEIWSDKTKLKQLIERQLK